MHTASSGMQAQSQRLKIIAENIAGKDSVATDPSYDPYLKKKIFFKSVYDKNLKANVVKVFREDRDYKNIPVRYEPNHPAANAEGYVKYPNVDIIIETADRLEADSSYIANLQVANASKSLLKSTLTMIEK
ncbi:MAG: flagellar basal-body rod protein FlgC [Candidatus Xenolissoclinum pacificiensis L6]|uniref:Flagellar basal-body rod protein FlgC n=1 Tax=Candidatus Xenolissoclinum pacificiensis L6 TaxID=1401685 RepID=W2V263_9RICK|nr:MAG: flagellar basal-body rod protein FlgC [Candidatus Xenolissoclinum pacificiensis L6]